MPNKDDKNKDYGITRGLPMEGCAGNIWWGNYIMADEFKERNRLDSCPAEDTQPQNNCIPVPPIYIKDETEMRCR